MDIEETETAWCNVKVQVDMLDQEKKLEAGDTDKDAWIPIT